MVCLWIALMGSVSFEITDDKSEESDFDHDQAFDALAAAKEAMAV